MRYGLCMSKCNCGGFEFEGGFVHAERCSDDEPEAITIGAGVVATVHRGQIVKLATCLSAGAAEDAAIAFVDDDEGLGVEQYLGFGPWTESTPSGWRETRVESL